MASSTSPALDPSTSSAVLIIGGGIAGCALALFLSRLNISARVFEAYPETVEVGGGLQVAPNGGNVLRALGLHTALAESGAVCRTFRLCNHHGQTLMEIPLKGRERYGVDAITCSRHALRTVLLNALTTEGVRVEYHKRLTSLHQTEAAVTASFEDGTVAVGQVLVGADGIHSITRTLLFPTTPSPVYMGFMSGTEHSTD